MDFLQLSQFRVLARVQHMTLAAEELYITQPSLSKAIKHLEKELGVPLFDRIGRRIRLNQFGQTFLEQVNQAFSALEGGKCQMRDMAQLGQGEVVMAAVTLHWLPDLLHAFQLEHPDTRFRLFQRLPSEMQRQLDAGEIDFGFTHSPIKGPNIQWHPLLTQEILLAVPCGHRLAGRGSVPLHEIAEESVVIGRQGNVMRDLMDEVCGQAGFTLRVTCEADEAGAIRDFVRAGLGVAFIPTQIRQSRDEEGLAWLSITQPSSHITLGVAWHEMHYLSGVARVFQDFILRYFKESSLSNIGARERA